MHATSPSTFACRLLLVAALGTIQIAAAHAATFVFGSDQNGLTGLSSKTLSDGGFDLLLSVGFPAGGQFYEVDNRGLSISSEGLTGINDEEGQGKINLLSGTGVPADSAESVEFSFDKPGVLTELDFDGVKDEPYEYFLFQTATSPDIYFFDSFINSEGGDPSYIDVPGPVIFLQEGNTFIDDRSPPLAIPFEAGQIFTITYGQLDDAQPNQPLGNGARFQGLTVQTVPEPSSVVLLAVGLWTGIVLLLRQRG